LLRSIGERIARRIVLVTPRERTSLDAMKSAGCTGYLVKPVRGASLAALLGEAETAEPALDVEIAPDAETPPAPNGLAVLVAEDNEINALLVRALLAKLGHRPTMTASGTAAIETWRTAREHGRPFDLVLMDVHMPGVDGLEATRRIRAAETEGAHTPIIALTANAFSEDREACLAAGMDAFLVKPLERDGLAAAIAELQGRALLAA
jgi:CheY-like chemotaxis protein